MSDIAQLITAMAALVTSLGGALAAVIVATRSGNRQAAIASKRTMEMGNEEDDDIPDEEELERMLETLRLQRLQGRDRQPQRYPRREGGRR